MMKGTGLDFSVGRSDGFPTRYPDQKTPAHVDVLTSGLITAFLIVGIGFLAIIPANKSLSRRGWVFCRIVLSIFIGGVILVGNYGHDWEKGEIKMSAPYKPGVPDEIEGKLGLHISLRGINVTLNGKPSMHGQEKGDHGHSVLAKEKIDYNEHFSWEWGQGRFGFGKYAGQISRDFREAAIRGAPLPILQVAEYFTFDGEGIRFGRYYRLAGWYTHLIMWFAFGTWLITNILFCMVIRTAALFLFITGCLQISGVGVWYFLRNPIEIQIPFQTVDGKGDIFLKTHFGLDFYLVFANGILCVLLSGLATFLDSVMPDEMCQAFGIDPLTIYDELLLSKDEVKEEKRRLTLLQDTSKHDPEMQSAPIIINPDGLSEESEEGNFFLKRRTNPASVLVRKSFRNIKPRIPRRSKGISTDSHSSAAEQAVRLPLLQKRISTSDDEEIERHQDYGNLPLLTPEVESSFQRKGSPPPPPVPRRKR